MDETEVREHERYDDPEEEDAGTDLREYDITATPNDFNVETIYNYIEKRTLEIPDFQRNYVWDIKRASKLIESLLLGLPVPQLFLFEKERNRFLVIDGQQRLLTLYYFKKGRFPRLDKRTQIRRIFDSGGGIPDSMLHNDEYFVPFALQLPDRLPAQHSPFKGLNYLTLESYKDTFDLRPIRNVVIKQNSPRDDTSSIFEIFNRLNTGGVNLTPQEIRASLFHSKFYDLLRGLNLDRRWRRFLLSSEPDLHLKDVEIILRSFAMLHSSAKYAPSMVQFLNTFSKDAKSFSADQIEHCKEIFEQFLDAASELGDRTFINEGNKRFNVALLEGTFEAATRSAYHNGDSIKRKIDPESISELRTDTDFVTAASKASADSKNVDTRLKRARAIVKYM